MAASPRARGPVQNPSFVVGLEWDHGTLEKNCFGMLMSYSEDVVCFRGIYGINDERFGNSMRIKSVDPMNGNAENFDPPRYAATGLNNIDNVVRMMLTK